MQLSHYISDLLYRYECVTLPNFGAFLSHPIPARIKGISNFYPPQKQLSFNVQLKSNDGLLASYISDVENISFEVATSKIENQVSQLKLRLEKGETVEFKARLHIKDERLQLPEISRFDPQALVVGIRPGEVCKIDRSSVTALSTEYYRVCV